MKKFSKFLALALVLVMVLSCFAGCKEQPADPTQATEPKETKTEYTYRDYTTYLGNTWNPHDWKTNADYAILQYLETPLVAAGIQNSEKGQYQWVYKAATSITDVTKENAGDLTKYQVTLPQGATAESGYVFEIKLNPDLKWQDGTAINADTYIYSMKALLDPAKQNYQASRYYAGETAVAGGFNYYHALTKNLYVAVAYGSVPVGETVYMDVWSMCNAQDYVDATGKKCPQYIASDDATIYYNADGSKTISGKILWATSSNALNGGQHPVYLYRENENYNENYAANYDATVGCYKVDDYTIRYVTQNQTDLNTFLAACNSNWLVYKDLYEASWLIAAGLRTSQYATSLETTMSYGPYKLESLKAGEQAVFVQNENYYQYQKQADGTLYAETDYEEDGQKVQAYQTTKIIIDVMTEEEAKQAFLKGELSRWVPTAEDMVDYSESDQLYCEYQAGTYALFFNTDTKTLQKLDTKGNKNSVVLSSTNFRKAMSMAIDRRDWVSTTPGYAPAYYLLNDTYYFDIYNDPFSNFRGTQQAQQSMCDLYGVKYVDGAALETLDEAYLSISGYRPEDAKSLMKSAYQELVAAGLYKAGEEIQIQIAYSDEALTAADEAQVEAINQYLNTAMEGSGFGKITLVAVGQIKGHESKVSDGEYAMGYGVAGSNPYEAFAGMQAYCDTDKNYLAELGCWNPAAETLTIQIDGKKVTKTWQEWSRSLTGDGEYANAILGVKLNVITTMEREFLAKFYRIPLAADCVASIQSYQVKNYTDAYNIMYGFGGMELLSYHYTDAQWADYVAEEKGELNYE